MDNIIEHIDIVPDEFERYVKGNSLRTEQLNENAGESAAHLYLSGVRKLKKRGIEPIYTREVVVGIVCFAAGVLAGSFAVLI